MSQQPTRPRRVAGRVGRQRTFREAAGWTALGTYLPGLGLIRAGLRRLGAVPLGVFAGLVLLLVGWALVDRNSLLKLGVNADFLWALVVVLPLVALAWAALVVVSHLRLRPERITQAQRGIGAALVGLLCFSITAPLAVAARYSFDQASLLSSIFRRGSDIRSGTAPKMDGRDPWKNKARVNILLLGGDYDKDRTGTRTDTVIVASIDTKTGDTVLISLPRNATRVPFPADSPLHQYYPDGFNDSEQNLLNEVYESVPENVPADVLGPTDNLGADALKLAVGEATGLKLDYYVLLELQGFHKLLDALGGVTVNINTWVAIGGDTSLGIKPAGALRPGPNQKLNGSQAMWFARGRYGADDFQRMDRQRCVIDAVIKQANPAQMLTHYEEIARSSRDLVKTDMPSEILPAMVDLSMRVKNGKSKSLVFKHGVDGFFSGNVDWNLVRARSLAAVAPKAPAAPSQAPQPQQPSKEGPQQPTQAPTSQAPTTAPTRGATSQPPAPSAPAGTAPPAPTPPPAGPPPEDLSFSCEFKPEIAAAQPPRPPWEM
ncbi:LCP family protein [Mariniluteicoccus flavus]